MNPQLTKKYALVSGGNKAINFAIYQGLLAADFEVILAARSLDKAEQAVAELPAAAKRSVAMDVTNDDSIRRAASELSQQITHLDVLVNNAGIYPDAGVDILTVSRHLLQAAMDTNTFGSSRLPRHFYRFCSRQLERVSSTFLVDMVS